MTKVKLKIDNTAYTGWQTVNVVRSIEALAGRFDLQLTQKTPFPIQRGGSVELRLYDELVITGYADSIEPEITKDEYKISARGRDKTGDLVDASALVESQELLNVTLREIIETIIEPFGIKATFEQEPPERFKKFSFQEESGFEAIERACRLRGVFASSDAQGNIVIQEYGAIRTSVGLTLGENVLSVRSLFEENNRFSEYLVYGQQAGDDNISAAASASPSGSAKDSSVKRYRPLIIIAEGSIDSATAQQRAEWEATVRAARAETSEVTVQGWRPDPNTPGLWRENRLVRCNMPQAGIVGDMLIKEVRFSLTDTDGEKTALMLVRPDAYIKKPEIEDKEGLGYE